MPKGTQKRHFLSGCNMRGLELRVCKYVCVYVRVCARVCVKSTSVAIRLKI